MLRRLLNINEFEEQTISKLLNLGENLGCELDGIIEDVVMSEIGNINFAWQLMHDLANLILAQWKNTILFYCEEVDDVENMNKILLVDYDFDIFDDKVEFYLYYDGETIEGGNEIIYSAMKNIDKSYQLLVKEIKEIE